MIWYALIRLKNSPKSFVIYSIQSGRHLFIRYVHVHVMPFVILVDRAQGPPLQTSSLRSNVRVSDAPYVSVPIEWSLRQAKEYFIRDPFKPTFIGSHLLSISFSSSNAFLLMISQCIPPYFYHLNGVALLSLNEQFHQQIYQELRREIPTTGQRGYQVLVLAWLSLQYLHMIRCLTNKRTILLMILAHILSWSYDRTPRNGHSEWFRGKSKEKSG